MIWTSFHKDIFESRTEGIISNWILFQRLYEIQKLTQNCKVCLSWIWYFDALWQQMLSWWIQILDTLSNVMKRDTLPRDWKHKKEEINSTETELFTRQSPHLYWVQWLEMWENCCRSFEVERRLLIDLFLLQSWNDTIYLLWSWNDTIYLLWSWNDTLYYRIELEWFYLILFDSIAFCTG